MSEVVGVSGEVGDAEIVRRVIVDEGVPISCVTVSDVDTASDRVGDSGACEVLGV